MESSRGGWGKWIGGSEGRRIGIEGSRVRSIGGNRSIVKESKY